MTTLKNIELKGREAVRKLRNRTLQSGQPFMINSRELPEYECYLEYPNGSIKLVTIVKAARDFTVIRELSPQETVNIRARLNLH